MRITDWHPYNEKRSRKRPDTRSRDEIGKFAGVAEQKLAQDRQLWKELGKPFIQQWTYNCCCWWWGYWNTLITEYISWHMWTFSYSFEINFPAILKQIKHFLSGHIFIDTFRHILLLFLIILLCTRQRRVFQLVHIYIWRVWFQNVINAIWKINVFN